MPSIVNQNNTGKVILRKPNSMNKFKTWLIEGNNEDVINVDGSDIKVKTRKAMLPHKGFATIQIYVHVSEEFTEVVETGNDYRRVFTTPPLKDWTVEYLPEEDKFILL